MTELGRAEERITGNVRWGETVPDRARPCQTGPDRARASDERGAGLWLLGPHWPTPHKRSPSQAGARARFLMSTLNA